MLNSTRCYRTLTSYVAIETKYSLSFRQTGYASFILYVDRLKKSNTLSLERKDTTLLAVWTGRTQALSVLQLVLHKHSQSSTSRYCSLSALRSTVRNVAIRRELVKQILQINLIYLLSTWRCYVLNGLALGNHLNIYVSKYDLFKSSSENLLGWT